MKGRALLLAVTLLAASATLPATVSGASNGADPKLNLIALVNQARAERGLVPLRSDSRLWGLAGDRATRLATSGVLSHEVAGPMRQDLAAGGVRWYGYGEVIGYLSGVPAVAAPVIFRMWMESPSHWPLLMSADYNYLGVGLVYQASSGRTYASIVLTELPDRSGARGAMVGAVVSGSDIHWSWRGSDLRLQTHTAGLHDFTVQLRTDHGPWVTLASGSTATARTTADLERGHWYGLRVCARDRAGNVGPWSRELRVWLP